MTVLDDMHVLRTHDLTADRTLRHGLVYRQVVQHVPCVQRMTPETGTGNLTADEQAELEAMFSEA